MRTADDDAQSEEDADSGGSDAGVASSEEDGEAAAQVDDDYGSEGAVPSDDAEGACWKVLWALCCEHVARLLLSCCELSTHCFN